MKYLKLIVINKVLVLILCFCYLNSHGTSKVLIKANVLRGERFVTIKTNVKEIENKVSEVFRKKGFDVVANIELAENMLLVDLFIYQYPYQHPTITITVRSQNGIHYIEQDFGKGLDRDLTNLNLAIELAERAPTEFNQDLVYRVGIENIISANRTNTSGSMSNALLLAGKRDYYSTIKWQDDINVPFIAPKELGLYLFYASNFIGLKKHLARGPIVLKVRINDSARFELVDINSSLSLDEVQKNTIHEFIDAFPLWSTSTKVENIEIMYGLK